MRFISQKKQNEIEKSVLKADIVILHGPSGSGKSFLLHSAAKKFGFKIEHFDSNISKINFYDPKICAKFDFDKKNEVKNFMRKLQTVRNKIFIETTDFLSKKEISSIINQNYLFEEFNLEFKEIDLLKATNDKLLSRNLNLQKNNKKTKKTSFCGFDIDNQIDCINNLKGWKVLENFKISTNKFKNSSLEKSGIFQEIINHKIQQNNEKEIKNNLNYVKNQNKSEKIMENNLNQISSKNEKTSRIFRNSKKNLTDFQVKRYFHEKITDLSLDSISTFDSVEECQPEEYKKMNTFSLDSNYSFDSDINSQNNENASLKNINHISDINSQNNDNILVKKLKNFSDINSQNNDNILVKKLKNFSDINSQNNNIYFDISFSDSLFSSLSAQNNEKVLTFKSAIQTENPLSFELSSSFDSFFQSQPEKNNIYNQNINIKNKPIPEDIPNCYSSSYHKKHNNITKSIKKIRKIKNLVSENTQYSLLHSPTVLKSENHLISNKKVKTITDNQNLQNIIQKSVVCQSGNTNPIQFKGLKNNEEQPDISSISETDILIHNLYDENYLLKDLNLETIDFDKKSGKLLIDKGVDPFFANNQVRDLQNREVNDESINYYISPYIMNYFPIEKSKISKLSTYIHQYPISKNKREIINDNTPKNIIYNEIRSFEGNDQISCIPLKTGMKIINKNLKIPLNSKKTLKNNEEIQNWDMLKTNQLIRQKITDLENNIHNCLGFTNNRLFYRNILSIKYYEAMNRVIVLSFLLDKFIDYLRHCYHSNFEELRIPANAIFNITHQIIKEKSKYAQLSRISQFSSFLCNNNSLKIIIKPFSCASYEQTTTVNFNSYFFFSVLFMLENFRSFLFSNEKEPAQISRIFDIENIFSNQQENPVEIHIRNSFICSFIEIIKKYTKSESNNKEIEICSLKYLSKEITFWISLQFNEHLLSQYKKKLIFLVDFCNSAVVKKGWQLKDERLLEIKNELLILFNYYKNKYLNFNISNFMHFLMKIGSQCFQTASNSAKYSITSEKKCKPKTIQEEVDSLHQYDIFVSLDFDDLSSTVFSQSNQEQKPTNILKKENINKDQKWSLKHTKSNKNYIVQDILTKKGICDEYSDSTKQLFIFKENADLMPVNSKNQGKITKKQSFLRSLNTSLEDLTIKPYRDDSQIVKTYLKTPPSIKKQTKEYSKNTANHKVIEKHKKEYSKEREENCKVIENHKKEYLENNHIINANCKVIEKDKKEYSKNKQNCKVIEKHEKEYSKNKQNCTVIEKDKKEYSKNKQNCKVIENHNKEYLENNHIINAKYKVKEKHEKEYSEEREENSEILYKSQKNWNIEHQKNRIKSKELHFNTFTSQNYTLPEIRILKVSVIQISQPSQSSLRKHFGFLIKTSGNLFTYIIKKNYQIKTYFEDQSDFFHLLGKIFYTNIDWNLLKDFYKTNICNGLIKASNSMILCNFLRVYKLIQKFDNNTIKKETKNDDYCEISSLTINRNHKKRRIKKNENENVKNQYKPHFITKNSQVEIKEDLNENHLNIIFQRFNQIKTFWDKNDCYKLLQYISENMIDFYTLETITELLKIQSFIDKICRANHQYNHLIVFDAFKASSSQKNKFTTFKAPQCHSKDQLKFNQNLRFF